MTPYLNEAQITSGTLAYSVGAGKAVISTPYWYAEELLAEGRGLMAPFKDAKAIADRVIELLDNETERHAMRKRAYALGRDMVWKRVAQKYMDSFERAREERFRKPGWSLMAKTADKGHAELPPLKLDHLRRMTDDTGLIQHAKFSVRDYNEGYSTDDNARALILMVLLEEMGEAPPETTRELAGRYLAFLLHAFDQDQGRFRNFLAYDRRWLKTTCLEDCHGRSLWGLGTVAGRLKDEGLRGLAVRLFADALPATLKFTSPRACAYTLLGIMEFLRRFYGHRAAADCRTALAERLLEQYEANRSKSGAGGRWLWLEDILSYGNAKLPHALILCGQWMERGPMVEAGLESLRWLVDIQRAGGDHLVPIGCNGFYPRGGTRARFDQQPIEAHATMSACLEAFRMTRDEFWYKEAQRAFDWFFGRNDLGMSLYDPRTGGCFDGISSDRINQNQGAESTLAYLLARTEMAMAQHLMLAPAPDAEETKKK